MAHDTNRKAANSAWSYVVQVLGYLFWKRAAYLGYLQGFSQETRRY